MLYKTELHCHTAEVSACAAENAADTVKRYVDAGYTTVVLTNHINRSTKYFNECEYEKAVERFIDGYKVFARQADGKLNALFSVELRLKGRGDNDYLIYGLTEDFLRRHPDMMEYDIKDIRRLCDENSYLLIQAHPFRTKMTITKPELLDGVEVFNGSTYQMNHNEIADMWANYYGMIKTSGTDHHDPADDATGGILTEEPITDIRGLVDVLKSGKYRLLRSM